MITFIGESKNFIGAKSNSAKLLTVKLLFNDYSRREMEAYIMQRKVIYELAIRSRDSEEFLDQLNNLLAAKRRGRPRLRIIEGGKSASKATATVRSGSDRDPFH